MQLKNISIKLLKKIYKLFFEKSVYSAKYEDELLLDFFSTCSSGTFCDIGANMPDSSVCLPFLKMGWIGIAVDPIPSNAKSLSKAGFDVFCGAVTSSSMALKGKTSFFLAGGESGRKSSLDSEKIDPNLKQFEINVNLITLAKLFDMFSINKLDLLSIDVEGHEADVLDTLQKDFDCKLILIEDWARDRKIDLILNEKGYKRVRRTGYNSWYVKNNTDFNVSIFGKFHLIAKLNWFSSVRRLRFLRKKSLAQNKIT